MFNNKIKKRIALLSAGTFLVLAIMGGFAVLMGWTYNQVVLPNLPFEKSIRTFEKQMQTIRILCMGASGVRRAVDPAQFPSKTYNFAYAGENYAITYLKLKTYINAMPQLEMVLLPVSYANFSSALLSRNSVYSSTLTKNREFFDTLPLKLVQRSRWPHTGGGLIPLLTPNQIKYKTSEAFDALFPRFSSLIFTMGITDQSPVDPRTGYARRRGSEVTTADARLKSERLFEGADLLDPVLLSYFIKTVQLCHRNQIKVLTIATPFTDLLISHAEHHIRLKTIYEATIFNPDIQPMITAHYDYATLFPTTYEYFWDTNHLNHQGAQILSQKLACQIETLR